MATHSNIVTKASDGALQQIRQNAPAEYAKLDADSVKKKQLIQAARETATECLQLAAEFLGQPTDIAERLAKHLSKDRIQLIRLGLSIPTFQMDVIKKEDGKYLVKLSKNGNPFMTGTRDLSVTADVDWSNTIQEASILVEAVLLVMSAVGISVNPSEEVMEKTVEDVVHEIETSSTLQRAIEDFISAWNTAGANAWEKATAIFNLLKDTYAAGILWTIIESLCKEMAWYDWLETAARVSAMIIAALATEGAALIAEIALIVLDAVDFARKIGNIVQLNEIKKTFKN